MFGIFHAFGVCLVFILGITIPLCRCILQKPEEPSTVPSRELDHRHRSLFLSSALTQDFILGFLEASGWWKCRWVGKRQEGDKKSSTGSPPELRLREMQPG